MSRRGAPDPVVSVILPCRDAENHLPECIDSLESQTLDRYEVLAVDDRSVDGTRHVLEAWAERDERVRVLRTDREAGLVPALKLAVAAARSSLLARMDADDVALPRRLELQVEHMRAHRAPAAGAKGG